MEFSVEQINNNVEILKDIFACMCGTTLVIGEPVFKTNTSVLDSFDCICPNCKSEYLVKVSFEEK